MKKRNWQILSFIYQFIMIFGFIANMQFGPITTRRVAILVSLITILLKWDNVRLLRGIINTSRMGIAFVLFVCCIIITFINTVGIVRFSINDYYEPREIITLIIGILSFGVWCAIEIDSFKRFSLLIIVFIVVQTLVVFLTSISQPLRIFIAEHFMSEHYLERSHNIVYGMGGRAAGLGIAWSMGSLILAYCCFVIVIYKIRYGFPTLMFSIVFAMSLGATALMGRTGFILELGLLIYFGFIGHKIKNILSLFIISAGSAIVVSHVLSNYDMSIASGLLEWMFQFADKEGLGRINEGVVQNGFPPFSSDFIIGTGVVAGHYGDYSFYSDSGYIRSYTSIGVVGMFCYYVGILSLLLSVISKQMVPDIKRLLWLGIIAVFVLEYKEPYISMTVIPWLLFTMALMISKDVKYNKYENSYSG